MSKKPVEEHYDILYQDEQGTRFTVAWTSCRVPTSASGKSSWTI